jgi:hypothetical protein
VSSPLAARRLLEVDVVLRFVGERSILRVANWLRAGADSRDAELEYAAHLYGRGVGVLLRTKADPANGWPVADRGIRSEPAPV